MSTMSFSSAHTTNDKTSSQVPSCCSQALDSAALEIQDKSASMVVNTIKIPNIITTSDASAPVVLTRSSTTAPQATASGTSSGVVPAAQKQEEVLAEKSADNNNDYYLDFICRIIQLPELLDCTSHHTAITLCSPYSNCAHIHLEHNKNHLPPDSDCTDHTDHSTDTGTSNNHCTINNSSISVGCVQDTSPLSESHPIIRTVLTKHQLKNENMLNGRTGNFHFDPVRGHSEEDTVLSETMALLFSQTGLFTIDTFGTDETAANQAYRCLKQACQSMAHNYHLFCLYEGVSSNPDFALLNLYLPLYTSRNFTPETDITFSLKHLSAQRRFLDQNLSQSAHRAAAAPAAADRTAAAPAADPESSPVSVDVVESNGQKSRSLPFAHKETKYLNINPLDTFATSSSLHRFSSERQTSTVNILSQISQSGRNRNKLMAGYLKEHPDKASHFGYIVNQSRYRRLRSDNFLKRKAPHVQKCNSSFTIKPVLWCKYFNELKQISPLQYGSNQQFSLIAPESSPAAVCAETVHTSRKTMLTLPCTDPVLSGCLNSSDKAQAHKESKQSSAETRSFSTELPLFLQQVSNMSSETALALSPSVYRALRAHACTDTSFSDFKELYADVYDQTYDDFLFLDYLCHKSGRLCIPYSDLRCRDFHQYGFFLETVIDGSRLFNLSRYKFNTAALPITALRTSAPNPLRPVITDRINPYVRAVAFLLEGNTTHQIKSRTDFIPELPASAPEVKEDTGTRIRTRKSRKTKDREAAEIAQVVRNLADSFYFNYFMARLPFNVPDYQTTDTGHTMRPKSSHTTVVLSSADQNLMTCPGRYRGGNLSRDYAPHITLLDTFQSLTHHELIGTLKDPDAPWFAHNNLTRSSAYWQKMEQLRKKKIPIVLMSQLPQLFDHDPRPFVCVLKELHQQYQQQEKVLKADDSRPAYNCQALIQTEASLTNLADNSTQNHPRHNSQENIHSPAKPTAVPTAATVLRAGSAAVQTVPAAVQATRTAAATPASSVDAVDADDKTLSSNPKFNRILETGHCFPGSYLYWKYHQDAQNHSNFFQLYPSEQLQITMMKAQRRQYWLRHYHTDKTTPEQLTALSSKNKTDSFLSDPDQKLNSDLKVTAPVSADIFPENRTQFIQQNRESFRQVLEGKLARHFCLEQSLKFSKGNNIHLGLILSAPNNMILNYLTEELLLTGHNFSSQQLPPDNTAISLLQLEALQNTSLDQNHCSYYLGLHRNSINAYIKRRQNRLIPTGAAAGGTAATSGKAFPAGAADTVGAADTTGTADAVRSDVCAETENRELSMTAIARQQLGSEAVTEQPTLAALAASDTTAPNFQDEWSDNEDDNCNMSRDESCHNLPLSRIIRCRAHYLMLESMVTYYLQQLQLHGLLYHETYRLPFIWDQQHHLKLTAEILELIQTACNPRSGGRFCYAEINHDSTRCELTVYFTNRNTRDQKLKQLQQILGKSQDPHKYKVKALSKNTLDTCTRVPEYDNILPIKLISAHKLPDFTPFMGRTSFVQYYLINQMVDQDQNDSLLRFNHLNHQNHDISKQHTVYLDDSGQYHGHIDFFLAACVYDGFKELGGLSKTGKVTNIPSMATFLFTLEALECQEALFINCNCGHRSLVFNPNIMTAPSPLKCRCCGHSLNRIH